MSEFNNESIWIIGASSGIGRALAKELANQHASLILSARSADDLEELNKQLGGTHTVLPLDVSNNDEVIKAVESIAATGKKLDRTVFLAAIYKPGDTDKRDAAFAQKLVEVNLTGAIYVSYATLAHYKKQKSGQLTLCGSVAGFTGLPGGQPYSATKAAIINFAESLHAEEPEYIDIKLINPGFVRTRMTDKNKFTMPMRIEPEQAAREIAKGLKSKAFEIHFPKTFTLGVKFLRLLPYCVALYFTGKMRDKA